MLPDAEVHLYSLTDNYEKAILDFDEEFDIILIDGRNRVDCFRYALDKLSDKGIIIFDDFQRGTYIVLSCLSPDR